MTASMECQDCSRAFVRITFRLRCIIAEKKPHSVPPRANICSLINLSSFKKQHATNDLTFFSNILLNLILCIISGYLPERRVTGPRDADGVQYKTEVRLNQRKEESIMEVNRRQFIQITGATAAGLAVSGLGFEMDKDGVPKMDRTLKHPRCVFQLLKKHFNRYNVKLVSQISGTPEGSLLEIYKTYGATAAKGKPAPSCMPWAGPSRPSAPKTSEPWPSFSCCSAVWELPAAV